MSSRLSQSILSSLSILMVISGCQPTVQPNVRGTVRTPSKISYRATDHRPYIITGRSQSKPFWWLVDSGATQSVVVGDPVSLSARGITMGAKQKLNIHGMFQSQNSRIPSFVFNDPNLPEIRGYVLAANQQRRTGGIIGVKTLTQHRALLLFPKKKLIWENQESYIPPGKRIKITRHPSTGHWILRAHIHGRSAHFIIDTGASRSVLSYSSAVKFKLPLKQTRLSLRGIQQSQHVVFQIKKLTLKSSHGILLHKGEFLVTDLSTIQNRLTTIEKLQIDGILGYDILSSRFAGIDFGKGVLIKKP